MRTLLFVALLASAACEKNNKPPPPTSGAPNQPTESGPSHPMGGGAASGGAMAAARQIFANTCSTCHGMDGTGTGPAAASLGSARPRNYTDPGWQASVTDADIRRIILVGGQAVGKSPMMPPNPQLQERPEVLDAMVQIIRGFGKR
jgi:mono/diheme cytochrome c family protein